MLLASVRSPSCPGWPLPPPPPPPPPPWIGSHLHLTALLSCSLLCTLHPHSDVQCWCLLSLLLSFLLACPSPIPHPVSHLPQRNGRLCCRAAAAAGGKRRPDRGVRPACCLPTPLRAAAAGSRAAAAAMLERRPACLAAAVALQRLECDMPGASSLLAAANLVWRSQRARTGAEMRGSGERRGKTAHPDVWFSLQTRNAPLGLARRLQRAGGRLAAAAPRSLIRLLPLF